MTLNLKVIFLVHPKEYRIMTNYMKYIKYVSRMESTERKDYEHFIDEIGTLGRFWWMSLYPECFNGKESREGKKIQRAVGDKEIKWEKNKRIK